jgi:nucleotide-binding universal stress UspA family protein
MIALRRILVPHDLDDSSNAAMEHAIALAWRFGAVLDVLHVGHRTATVPTEFPSELDPDLEATTRERLRRITSRDETTPAVELHVRVGSPHAEIIRFANERPTDLIVMGTHGRGALAHAVMGSVAERVVRGAACPVLTVRNPPQELAVRKILVATDFGAASDTALAYGRTLAQMFKGRLDLLHVMPNPFLGAMFGDPHSVEAATRRQLRERLTDADRDTLGATAMLEVSDDPASTIIEHAKRAHIDFIVLGTHGRHSIDRLLTGSVAEHVVRHASCPVLTVRHPEREFIVADAPAAAEKGVPVAGDAADGDDAARG